MLVDAASTSACRVGLAVGDPATLDRSHPCPRINLEPGKVEQGLLKLVLAVVELLRQLMEKQAMRRIDAGSLSPGEIDRLGSGLLELEAKIRELQARFEIDDLNIDLGPLGHLVD